MTFIYHLIYSQSLTFLSISQKSYKCSMIMHFLIIQKSSQVIRINSLFLFLPVFQYILSFYFFNNVYIAFLCFITVYFILRFGIFKINLKSISILLYFKFYVLFYMEKFQPQQQNINKMMKEQYSYFQCYLHEI